MGHGFDNLEGELGSHMLSGMEKKKFFLKEGKSRAPAMLFIQLLIF